MAFGDFQLEQRVYVAIDKDTKLFRVKHPDGGTAEYESMSGILTKIEYKEYEYEGRPAPKLQCTFIDHKSGSEFVFSTGFNAGYCRTILNSLASVEGTLGVIAMQLKAGKNKETGKDVTYLNVFNDFEYLRWKYQDADMPAVERITDKKGNYIKTEDSDRMDWFRDTVLPAIQAKLPTAIETRRLIGESMQMTDHRAQRGQLAAPKQQTEVVTEAMWKDEPPVYDEEIPF